MKLHAFVTTAEEHLLAPQMTGRTVLPTVAPKDEANACRPTPLLGVSQLPRS